MRTPDGEAEGTQASGAETSSSPLADGFGQAESGSGSGETDDAFGSGWPSGTDGGGGDGGGDETTGAAETTETTESGDDLFASFARGADTGGELGSDDPLAADGTFGLDESSFADAQDDMAAFDDGGESSAFAFDSDNVADGEDNLDFDGDGTTDAGDGPAALHGMHSFDDPGH